MENIISELFNMQFPYGGIVLILSFGFLVVLIAKFINLKAIWTAPKLVLNKEKGSILKTWVIPLPLFHFHHEPYRRESSHKNFIGRNDLSKKFLAIMRNSQNSSGSYLITGYRGVGKTSFVKKVLEDYKNGKPEISYAKRLSWYFSGFYQIYLWFIRRYGFISLWFHRLIYKSSDKKRSNPDNGIIFRKYLSAPISLLQKKYRFIFLLVVSVSFVCFSSPDTETKQILFFSLIASLILLKLFDKYGISIINPKQWRRWLFNPVLLLQINLGHERLETKQLLFDIASLLKIRYREGLGLISHKLLNMIMLFVLGAMLTNVVYSNSRWIEDIKYIEAEIQNSIFTVYQLESESLLRFPDKDNPISLEKWISKFTKKENELSAYTVASSKFNISVNEGKKNWKNLEKIFDERYLSRSEYEKALISVIGKDAKDRHILALLSFGDKSDDYVGSDAADFCQLLRSKNKENKENKLIYKADASLSQHIYCSANKILQDAYYWVWEGRPIDGVSEVKRWIKTGKERGINKECVGDYCNSWFTFTKQILLKNLFWLTAPNAKKNGVKYSGNTIEADIKEKAPRPYSIIVYLFCMFFVYIFYRILFSLGPGRVIRRLDYISKRIIATSDNLEVGTGLLLSGLAMRKSKEYHPLDSRQAEFLILDILETNCIFASKMNTHTQAT